MQYSGNLQAEYLSRKFVLTLIGLIGTLYVIIFVDKGVHYEWGAVLIGVIGQYAYFNYKESQSVMTNDNLKTIQDLTNNKSKQPIEKDNSD